jgi:hypothetical protein
VIVPHDLIVLALVERISAQTFPGKAGDLGLLRTFVDFLRLSIKNRHCFSSPRARIAMR